MKKLFLLFALIILPATASAQITSYERTAGANITSPVNFQIHTNLSAYPANCAHHQILALYLEPTFAYTTSRRVLSPIISTSSNVLNFNLSFPEGARITTVGVECYPNPPVSIGETGAPPAGGNQIAFFLTEGTNAGTPASRPTVFQIVGGLRFAQNITTSGFGSDLSATAGGAVGSVWPVAMVVMGLILSLFVVRFILSVFLEVDKRK